MSMHPNVWLCIELVSFYDTSIKVKKKMLRWFVTMWSCWIAELLSLEGFIHVGAELLTMWKAICSHGQIYGGAAPPKILVFPPQVCLFMISVPTRWVPSPIPTHLAGTRGEQPGTVKSAKEKWQGIELGGSGCALPCICAWKRDLC